jgi:hypothetical protein
MRIQPLEHSVMITDHNFQAGNINLRYRRGSTNLDNVPQLQIAMPMFQVIIHFITNHDW